MDADKARANKMMDFFMWIYGWIERSACLEFRSEQDYGCRRLRGCRGLNDHKWLFYMWLEKAGCSNINGRVFDFGIQIGRIFVSATLLNLDLGGAFFAFWGHDKSINFSNIFAAPMGAPSLGSFQN